MLSFEASVGVFGPSAGGGAGIAFVTLNGARKKATPRSAKKAQRMFLLASMCGTFTLNASDVKQLLTN
jgi:uncharacterized membrane protein